VDAVSSLSPDDNNPQPRPTLSPLNTNNVTSTRAPPRARSRTIQSIFSESHQGSPAISTPLLQGRPRRTSSIASSGLHGRPRASSVSSGDEGVPLDVIIPESPTGDVSKSLVEQYCDDPHHEHGGRAHHHGEGADDDHHAEMGPEHHDSVVNHLDVIGELENSLSKRLSHLYVPSVRADPSSPLSPSFPPCFLGHRSHHLGRLSLPEHLLWNPPPRMAHASTYPLDS